MSIDLSLHEFLVENCERGKKEKSYRVNALFVFQYFDEKWNETSCDDVASFYYDSLKQYENA